VSLGVVVAAKKHHVRGGMHAHSKDNTTERWCVHAWGTRMSKIATYTHTRIRTHARTNTHTHTHTHTTRARAHTHSHTHTAHLIRVPKRVAWLRDALVEAQVGHLLHQLTQQLHLHLLRCLRVVRVGKQASSTQLGTLGGGHNTCKPDHQDALLR
jgi:hypothetical protein